MQVSEVGESEAAPAALVARTVDFVSSITLRSRPRAKVVNYLGNATDKIYVFECLNKGRTVNTDRGITNFT